MSVPRNVPPEAIQTLDTFLGASLRHDEAAMRACVTRQTLESDRMRNDAPEGFTFALGEAKTEGENAIIPVALTPPGATRPAMRMECVMTLEDGAWKVDLGAALDRMMGGPMAEATEGMAADMAQAMESVGHAMSPGLHPQSASRTNSKSSALPQLPALPSIESPISQTPPLTGMPLISYSFHFCQPVLTILVWRSAPP